MQCLLGIPTCGSCPAARLACADSRVIEPSRATWTTASRSGSTFYNTYASAQLTGMYATRNRETPTRMPSHIANQGHMAVHPPVLHQLGPAVQTGGEPGHHWPAGDHWGCSCSGMPRTGPSNAEGTSAKEGNGIMWKLIRAGRGLRRGVRTTCQCRKWLLKGLPPQHTPTFHAHL
jgi:hypothetical protein